MQLHRLYMLRPRELRLIYESIGGKYDMRKRIKRGGTGSPFLYYSHGHPEIDKLNERCEDMLRINFEEFKKGMMLGITERTEPYIMPLKPMDVIEVNVHLQEEKSQPRKRSFYSWLLSKNVPLSIARFFAGSSEYEEPKTILTLQTTEYSIHGWATGEEYGKLRRFFEKSLLRDVLKVD